MSATYKWFALYCIDRADRSLGIDSLEEFADGVVAPTAGLSWRTNPCPLTKPAFKTIATLSEQSTYSRVRFPSSIGTETPLEHTTSGATVAVEKYSKIRPRTPLHTKQGAGSMLELRGSVETPNR